jgi:hypothetical protein
MANSFSLSPWHGPLSQAPVCYLGGLRKSSRRKSQEMLNYWIPLHYLLCIWSHGSPSGCKHTIRKITGFPAKWSWSVAGMLTSVRAKSVFFCYATSLPVAVGWLTSRPGPWTLSGGSGAMLLPVVPVWWVPRPDWCGESQVSWAHRFFFLLFDEK